MIQPPERIIISFVRFSSSLPFLPSPPPPFLSLFVRDRCARTSLQYTATVLWNANASTRPFPSSAQKRLSLSSLSRIIPLPRLVAPLVIESATRRRDSPCVDRGARRRARLRIPRDRFCRAFPSVDRYAWYWVTGRADGSRSPLFPSQSTPSVIGSGRLASTPVALPSVGDAQQRSFLRRASVREIYSRSRVCVALNYARSSLPIVSWEELKCYSKWVD